MYKCCLSKILKIQKFIKKLHSWANLLKSVFSLFNSNAKNEKLKKIIASFGKQAKMCLCFLATVVKRNFDIKVMHSWRQRGQRNFDKRFLISFGLRMWPICTHISPTQKVFLQLKIKMVWWPWVKKPVMGVSGPVRSF